MLTFLIFVVVLGVLVIVHELGHFFAAKKAGCRVEEFGIGFPPTVYSIKKGETKYALNALPLGGYVKIKGENGETSEDPRSFVNKSFAWKSLILSAGVLMNILLGYVLISIGLLFGSPTILDDTKLPESAIISDKKLQIVQLLPGAPAERAGIEIADEFISINDISVSSVEELSTILNSEQEEYKITIVRNNSTQAVLVKPEQLDGLEKKGIGIGLANTAMVSYPWYIAPFLGIARTAELLWMIITAFGALLVQLVTTGSAPADIAGPIGIAVITGQVAKQGFAQLLQFAALLSLNLAVINILPLPALDGGRLALVIIEKIRRKKVSIRLENIIHTSGFIFLLLLILLITIKDISTYGGGIVDSIKGIF